MERVVVREPEPEHYTPISGPSLLGLGGDDDSSSASSYLLDDDFENESRGRAGWYVFGFVALSILAVFGYFEWQAIKTGKNPIPWLGSGYSGPSAAQDQVPKASPPGPPVTQANAEANPATPSNPTTNSDQSLVGDETLKVPPSALDSTQSGSAANAPTQESQKNPVTPAQNAQPTPEAKSGETPPAVAAPPGKETPSRAAQTPQATETDVKEPEAEARKKPRSSVKPVKAEPAPDPNTNRMLISGERYLYGRGVRRDCNQALIYLRAAAEQDNAPAMSRLGAMYASGNCVTLDRRAAYKWFAKAQLSEPNNQWLTRNLNMLWRDMTPEERKAITH
ncbi:MAG TPA: hypothetical protein VN577_15535 [Terriglobales bacterium]|nr:hypothetical protein [Terriglobales bacterium]